MRFSAIFQLPLSHGAPEGEAARIEVAGIVAVPPAGPLSEPSRWPLDLPEDLDARVRMIGEWQLGEG